MRRRAVGSARRTRKSSPRSRVGATMTVSGAAPGYAVGSLGRCRDMTRAYFTPSRRWVTSTTRLPCSRAAVFATSSGGTLPLLEVWLAP